MITVVSGLPRSGTSLMMQMLAAGGLPVLSDGERAADASNPRGYYEWERIKTLPRDPDCIAEGEGKAVKVISALLAGLPRKFSYRVLFMQRPLAEVEASQRAMIRRLGTQDSALDAERMILALEAHLKQVKNRLDERPDLPVLYVDYHSLLEDARAAAGSIAEFLALPLDVQAMARQVDPTLYRERQGGATGELTS